MLRAAIGFRAHSGWAAAVAVGGGKVVDRRRVNLCDCLMPGSAQPYHAAARKPLHEAEAFLKRCADISAAMAEAALRRMSAELAAGGYQVHTCAILLGSGRASGDLAKTLASHPMIHTADGEFYRDTLREACRRCGLTVHGLKEREVRLRLAEAVEFGKGLGPPWREDEKLCTLAALSALQLRSTAA
jgi:hypothetical protein